MAIAHPAGPAGISPIDIPNVFGAELDELILRSKSHDVEIKGDDGVVLFTQPGVSAPERWSKRAVQVAASKYLYGSTAHRRRRVRDGGREKSIYQLHRRVASFIAEKAVELGYLDDGAATRFRREIQALTLGQYAAFNSPVWFNVGLAASYGLKGSGHAYIWDAKAIRPFADGEPLLARGQVRRITDTYKHPQGSACFIQSVKDDIDSIMELATNEARLFKYGSGSGTDLSTLRSRKEKLSSGGAPSGPLSFMRVYDTVASVIKSGGKTRRAAKMQTLHASHPDIMDFIRAKGVEEKKAQALIAQGYAANFNGEAYSSVFFQNANFSIRIPHAFMRRIVAGSGSYYDMGWPLKAVTDGRTVELAEADAIWRAIAEETWRCGDPGVQFCDTINAWHTTPRAIDGTPTPINSSNPCSEYLSVDDSACNLASLNLMRFADASGRIDIPRLRAAVHLMILAQEILVDACSYPTEAIARNAHDYRQLGLGFANLGGLIQANGLAYDSEDARLLAGSLAGIIGGEAYLASACISAAMGPFAAFEANRADMLRVIAMHAGAAESFLDRAGMSGRGRPVLDQIPALAAASLAAWDAALAAGAAQGYRNAQATVVAPTGTIAFTMDCDTTGIEPNLALAAEKTLAGGGTMMVVNGLVGRALTSLGFDEEEIGRISGYIAHNGTAEGCADLTDSQVAIFDTSFAPPGFTRVIDWRAHLLMMAEVGRFISGAISKTVNVPGDFTAAQIADVYRTAWELGLKCVAVYRDGSKGSQPLQAVGAAPEKVKCIQCGHPTLQAAGTCTICPECGTPQGGCS